MSSFVYITLDTSAPEIEIFAPSYTTTDIVTTIRIEANEDVSSFQEIYVIDSNGVRHDYTFDFEKANLLIGRISFFSFPFGETTIYARLMDEVGNKSSLVSKTFIIKETLTLLTLNIKDSNRTIDIDTTKTTIHISDSSKDVTITNSIKEVR